MAGERYQLYGLVPTERDVNEPMEFTTQAIGDKGEMLIYATDDREEARTMYEAGGFERSGVWHVVTRVEDRDKDYVTHKSGGYSRPMPQKPRNIDQG